MVNNKYTTTKVLALFKMVQMENFCFNTFSILCKLGVLVSVGVYVYVCEVSKWHDTLFSLSKFVFSWVTGQIWHVGVL